MSKIKEILMTRDGISSDEAEALISEAKEVMQEYIVEGDIFTAENICQEYLGLELDYLIELIEGEVL